MTCFCVRVKSTIRKHLRNNINDDNVEPRIVQEFPVITEDVHEVHTDNDEEGSSSDSLTDPPAPIPAPTPASIPAPIPAPIPASEKLFQIGLWPGWKRQVLAGQTGSDDVSRSWVLERLPDATPFKSMQRTEDILAALEFSYENCISEGPYRSENPGSAIYCTSLDRIAKFGCCALCNSIACTIRSKYPFLGPCSRFEKVVIWCAEWGNLEADEVNEAVAAEALQNMSVFLTIGGEKTSFDRFSQATIQQLLLDHHHWQFAQKMLSTCQLTHESCRAPSVGASPYIPRRLISIGSRPTDIRLIETDECDEKPANLTTYAALSYCWGTSGKNYKTTTQNLADNKIRLPLESLPDTITNAIDACKALGIPYLWVDAICIIQGDKKDWEEQSGKMREVYSNCILALAAEDTADCALGFLPRLLPKHRGTTPYSGKERKTIRTWSSDWGGKSTKMALSTRGWTLQERILPSRTLRFTSSGIVWECNQDFTALDQAQEKDLWYFVFRAIRLATSGRKDTSAPTGLDTSIYGSEDGHDITHRDIPIFLTCGSPSAIFYAWYSIAGNYSSRTLAKPADKLVALSGLASLLASCIPGGSDNYLAGVWRNDLAEGLLWHTEEPCARYSTYIAPSWSWASVDGKISYFHERNQFPFQSYVDIEESVCDKSFLDPTGSVSGGYIRLIGEVVPVHILVLRNSSTTALACSAHSPRKEGYVSKYHGSGGFGRAYKDRLVFIYPVGTAVKWHWEALCDEIMPLTTESKLKDLRYQDCEALVKPEYEPEFLCLSIGRMLDHYGDQKRFRHWWLLLEAVSPRAHVYKRIGIGYFHWRTPDIFNFATTQEVTII